MYVKLVLAIALITLTTTSDAAYLHFYHSRTAIASASAIVTKLCAEINNISAEQKTKVTDIINAFMEEKTKIIPLQESDKTAYEEKQASYFKTLKSKLSEVLVRAQLEKFLQLKPKVSETEHTLYYLFY